MDKNIKQILKDLYKMDKQLKKNKKQVEEIVTKLLADKPVGEIDENFLQQLKSELTRKLEQQSAVLKQPLMCSLGNSFSKLAYSLGGAFVVLAIGLPVLYFSMHKDLNEPIVSVITKKDGTSTGKLVANNPKATLKQKLEAQKKVFKFKDQAEAISFIKENSSDDYGTYNFGGRGGGSDMITSESLGLGFAQSTGLGSRESVLKSSMPVVPKVTVDTGTAVDKEFSRTNTQVAGVDEADIIKTDGNYVYAAVKKDLYIIKVDSAKSQEVLSIISFKNSIDKLYIQGNRLAVYGYDTSDYVSTRYSSNYSPDFTYLKVFDLTDKKNPKQLKDYRLEGHPKESRMIGDYVYLVTTKYQNYNDDNPIPLLIEDGKELSSSCAVTSTCYNPDIYHFDIPYYNFSFATINAINIKDTTKPVNSEVYLTNNADNMYVSQNNIYLTYTKYISEQELSYEAMKEVMYPLLDQDRKDRIKKIEAADSSVLSKSEKNSKVSQIYYAYLYSLPQMQIDTVNRQIKAKLKSLYNDISKELQKTIIHKIAIDKNIVKYASSGEVTGRVLNQFSMDENSKGYFRIATTKDRTWSSFDDSTNDSFNNMYVLDKDMKVVGKIEDLAKTEKIYSVRFMQDRAYMVTFKQTDPLYVIDLSQPTAPKVLGKLKIPGFSDYLHPYDQTTLIGVGKETKETGLDQFITKGIKIALFDVSDVTSPKEISKVTLGGRGSYSLVSQEHKAFLFSKENNILAIPVYLNEDKGDDYGKFSFQGLAAFSVDKTEGFKLKGKISHGTNKYIGNGDGWNNYYDYDTQIKRSFYITDDLFTFSDKYLKANKLSDLTEVSNLDLEAAKKKKSGTTDYDIIN